MMSCSRLLPLLALLSVPPAWAAPSFDCAKASGWVEHTVCTQAALGDLDRELADRYAAARRNAADEAALRDGQRAWARGRAACEKQADSVACLERHYRQRLTELGGRAVLPGWAGEIPGALAAIDSCVSATPSTAVAVTGLQRDGDAVHLALRGGRGRGFACRASRDGSRMVALQDAEAPPAGPSFRRGTASPCPSATPVATAGGGTIGWIVPPSC